MERASGRKHTNSKRIVRCVWKQLLCFLSPPDDMLVVKQVRCTNQERNSCPLYPPNHCEVVLCFFWRQVVVSHRGSIGECFREKEFGEFAFPEIYENSSTDRRRGVSTDTAVARQNVGRTVFQQRCHRMVTP